jgi:hypothetical protein
MKRVAVIEHPGHFYEPEGLTVTVDGEPVEVLGRWKRYRDGGTSIVETEQGRLYRPAPRRHGTPTLDGEPVELSWEPVAIRDSRSGR